MLVGDQLPCFNVSVTMDSRVKGRSPFNFCKCLPAKSIAPEISMHVPLESFLFARPQNIAPQSVSCRLYTTLRCAHPGAKAPATLIPPPPPSAPPETPPGEYPHGRCASCASYLLFVFRAACVCG